MRVDSFISWFFALLHHRGRRLNAGGGNWLVWHERASWRPLREAVTQGDGPATVFAVAQRLYDGVSVFHGCRPVNIELYQSQGVRPQSLEVLQASLRDLLARTHPDISSEDIGRAVSGTLEPAQPSRVYSCVDARQLLDGPNFFSARGSEYQQRVLIELSRIVGRDMPAALEVQGRPAVLAIGVRWGELNAHILEYLGEHLRDSLREMDEGNPPSPRDWCHSQLEAFPPERILSVKWLDMEI